MNMAWDLGAVDGAWELCGLLNYGCWIWCLCYILQWDRRRGGSEGQSHSPGIWNGGTEICRNILMRKYCRLQGPDIQGFMSQVYFVAVSLVTWCLVWSQSHRMLVALGTAPGPGDQQCTVSIRARQARGGNIGPVLAVSSEIWRNERKEIWFFCSVRI